MGTRRESEVARSERRHGIAVVWPFALLATVACADQVVGTFDGTGSASDPGSTAAQSDDGALDDGQASTTADGESSGGVGSGSTGEQGFVPPGCFADDFEDGVVDDAIWNTWIEEDANIEEIAGMLKFTPPSYGLFDTGLVSTYLYEIPFDDASVRIQAVTPPAPARPVVLFLQVIEDTRVLSIRMGSGQVAIDSTEDEVNVYTETFPLDPLPGWIGIRGEGNLVHFETSDDGVSWTILATHDQPVPLTAAHPLIMAQTYGDDPEGGIVVVDNFEACVQ